MEDFLKETYKGLGKKPANTKRIRTGWCGFCQKPAPLKGIKGIGCLCPTCGGRLWGNHPGITRHIFRG